MEAKKEFTKYFGDKKGDKVTIELEITGDPDAVMRKIYESFKDKKDLIEGATVKQIMFKGYDMERHTSLATERILSNVKVELENMVQEVKNSTYKIDSLKDVQI